MDEEYKEIAPELLERVKGNAWSIESMEGHGSGELSVTYIGSRISKSPETDGGIIFDYYQDSEGVYWFRNRKLLENGMAVSMEFHIFGKELKNNYRIRQKKNKK